MTQIEPTPCKWVRTIFALFFLILSGVPPVFAAERIVSGFEEHTQALNAARPRGKGIDIGADEMPD